MDNTEIKEEMQYLLDKRCKHGWTERDVVMYKHYGKLLGDEWDGEMPQNF